MFKILSLIYILNILIILVKPSFKSLNPCPFQLIKNCVKINVKNYVEIYIYINSIRWIVFNISYY